MPQETEDQLEHSESQDTQDYKDELEKQEI